MKDPIKTAIDHGAPESWLTPPRAADKARFFLENSPHLLARPVDQWDKSFETWERFKETLDLWSMDDGGLKPAPGHLVSIELTKADGRIVRYDSAMIMEADAHSASVCVQPMIPFFTRTRNGAIRLSIGGGPLNKVALSDWTTHAERSERRLALFKTWGPAGPGPDGAITASTLVPSWKMRLSEPEDLGFY